MLRDHGGAARLATLLDAGVGRRRLASLVDSGQIVRSYRGCYSLPGTPPAHVLASYFRAAVTCVTAAEMRGLRALRTCGQAHLEVDVNRSVPAARSEPHRHARLHRTRHPLTPGTVVDVPRALDVASGCTTAVEQIVLVDHALSLGLLSMRDVSSFELAPRARRAWLLRHAQPLSGSVPETCARVALVSAGLDVVCQPSIGGLQRADFLVDGRLFVEVDGYAHHSDRRQFHEDRARDRRLLASGTPVLRFTYDDAVRHPARLVAEVLAALAALPGGRLGR